MDGRLRLLRTEGFDYGTRGFYSGGGSFAKSLAGYLPFGDFGGTAQTLCSLCSSPAERELFLLKQDCITSIGGGYGKVSCRARTRTAL